MNKLRAIWWVLRGRSVMCDVKVVFGAEDFSAFEGKAGPILFQNVSLYGTKTKLVEVA